MTKRLRKLISEGIRRDMPGAWQLHPDEVAGVAAYVRTPGRAACRRNCPAMPVAGARVYAAKGCAGCHIVAGQGTGFGPELTRHRRAPQRGISAADRSSSPRRRCLTGSCTLPRSRLTGAAVRGIRVNEDSFTIQLRDAQGQISTVSANPSSRNSAACKGRLPCRPLKARSARAELDDLVAYLAGLKGKP